MLKRCSAINCQRAMFANRFLCGSCAGLVPKILQKEINSLNYRLKHNVAIITKEEEAKLKQRLSDTQELAVNTVFWATTSQEYKAF